MIAGQNGDAAGGIFNGSGSMTVTNSLVSGNKITHVANLQSRGGGIENGGKLSVTNTTIQGNTTDEGGGIADNSGAVVLLNDTISQNTASTTVPVIGAGGGGLFAFSDGFTLTNTIVAKNTGADCVAVPVSNPFISKGHNISSDSSCNLVAGGDQINTDPQLSALALNTPGQTSTMAIGATSPATDKADTSACPATDQRGVARKSDDVFCDIGAFEFIAAAAAAPLTLPRSGAPTTVGDPTPGLVGLPPHPRRDPGLGGARQARGLTPTE